MLAQVKLFISEAALAKVPAEEVDEWHFCELDDDDKDAEEEGQKEKHVEPGAASSSSMAVASSSTAAVASDCHWQSCVGSATGELSDIELPRPGFEPWSSA
eukprot:402362-Amphidinium_carterae.1